MNKAISLYDLVRCLSRAMDLVDKSLVHHHKRVANIASQIAEELGMPLQEQNRLILASLLHDCGALSLDDRLASLHFELSHPQFHSEAGYYLLAGFAPFADLADLVRFHHMPWDHGSGLSVNGKKVPLESHLIHLADRIAVLMGKHEDILAQAPSILAQIKALEGSRFAPVFVEAFSTLAAKEAFWLYAYNPPEFSHSRQWPLIEVSQQLEIASLFGRIIDFRNPFTAAHSSGVAASAEALAVLMGMSEEECQQMRLAGYLHDLGKLAIPTEILQKPDTLTQAERNIIRSHTFYTFTILDAIPEFETIKTWGAYHHERLTGDGYPFHLGESKLSLGSRIMAVADVFTAITEDRPYRKGMGEEQALKVLNSMVATRVLDGVIVEALKLRFDDLNAIRNEAQTLARQEYKTFERLSV